MRNVYDVIQRQIVSEKSNQLVEANNQYSFAVSVAAGKIAIRSAIEEIYKVRVLKVNTMLKKGKPKRFRGKLFFSKLYKKAVVSIHPDDKLE